MPTSLHVAQTVCSVQSPIFDPRQIAGLELWFDSADLATLYQDESMQDLARADGDPVGLWRCKVDSDRDAAQKTASHRPTLRLNVRNGKPVVRFVSDVGSGFGTSLIAGNFSLVQPNTTFVVASRVAGGYLIDGGSDAFNRHALLDNGGLYDMFAGAELINVAIDAGHWHVHENTWSGGSSQYLIDGSVIASGDAGGQPLGGLTIGSRYSLGASDSVNADEAEILIYHGSLSAAERALVRNYLRTKWGTP